MYELLDKINSPADVKALSLDELELLCRELRAYIIECCAVNPDISLPASGPWSSSSDSIIYLILQRTR